MEIYRLLGKEFKIIILKKRIDRTLGEMVKAKLYRQHDTKKHTHTHSQKKVI